MLRDSHAQLTSHHREKSIIQLIFNTELCHATWGQCPGKKTVKLSDCSRELAMVLGHLILRDTCIVARPIRMSVRIIVYVPTGACSVRAFFLAGPLVRRAMSLSTSRGSPLNHTTGRPKPPQVDGFAGRKHVRDRPFVVKSHARNVVPGYHVKGSQRCHVARGVAWHPGGHRVSPSDSD